MHVTLREILFATDFSDPAREAQKYAAAMAERFSARLHVLHVIPPLPAPVLDDIGAWTVPGTDQASFVEAAKKDLVKELGDKWIETHPTEWSVEVGFAVDEIIKYAKQHQIDIIVLGTHGNTGLSHLLLGSVAEKVVRLAECPVLTVHPNGHQFVSDSTVHAAALAKA